VAGKDLARNVLLVVQGNDHPALFPTLSARDLFWIGGDAPTLPLRCSAKVRYRQADQACIVSSHGDAATACISTNPSAPSRRGSRWFSTTGDECLGGGVIEGTAAAPMAIAA
jgi:tRNA-specific 2-thiouridylase